MKNINEPEKKPIVEEPKKDIKKVEIDVNNNKITEDSPQKNDNDDGWENHSGDIIMW